jgi:flagellar protein FliS
MRDMGMYTQMESISTNESKSNNCLISDRGGIQVSVNNPYQTYQQNAMNTASPGELTLMLYNGCLKFIKLAKNAVQEKKFEEKHINIIKVQNIIRELMVTLNMDVEVSLNMMQLYDYMLNRLVEANTKNDIGILNEVEGLVVEFRDTWKQVIQINRQQQYGQGSQHES